MSFTLDPYYSGSYTVTRITNYGGQYCPIYDYSNTNKILIGTSKGFDLVDMIRDSTSKKIIGMSKTGRISNYISTPKGEYPYYGSAYLDDNTLIYTDLQGYVCQIKPGDRVIGKRDKDIYIRRGYVDLPMSYFPEPGTGKILATVGEDFQAGLGVGNVHFYIGQYKNSYNYPPYKDIFLDYTGIKMTGVERGSKGLVRVPPTSNLFPNKSFLIIENGFNVYSCEYDSNLNPIVSTKRLFGSVPLVGSWPPRFTGGFVDPVTNDFVLFWSSYIYIISGFATPTQGETIAPNTNCYSSGDNSQGSFGLLNNISPLYYFTNIGRDKSIYSAKAGQNFSVILQEDGKLFGSGLNDQGQLGNPSVSLSLKFIQMGSDSDWSDLAVGSEHVIALKSNGDMYGCGSNSLGQLGQANTITKVNSLTKLNNTKWSKISTFHNFSFGIASDGTLWSTGDNSKGQLGRGTTVNSYLFRQVGTDTDWIEVSCGYDFTYAIKKGGGIYAVGNNEYGQLGLGNTFNQLVFVRTGITPNAPDSYSVKYRKVSAGTIHAVALSTSNIMYGVGYNLYGELGLGDTTSRKYWTQLGNEIWADVSAGSGYTLAIKSDSTLWGSGSNYQGCIGLGPGSSPTKDSKYLYFTNILLQSISTQPNWFKVFGSYDQSIALASYGLTTTTTTTTTSTTTTTTTSTTPGVTSSTTSTTQYPVTLSYGGFLVAGSTDSRGLFAGTSITDKLLFASEITYRSPSSDLSYKTDRLVGFSDLSNAGYLAGGYTTDVIKNSYSSSITKISYSTDVSNLTSATLANGRYYAASLSDADSKKGYVAGGYIESTATNSTERFDFTTDISSNLSSSNLSSNRAILASFSDYSAKGFYLGGISGSLGQTNYGLVSIVDKTLFSTNVTSLSSFTLESSTFGAVGLFSSYSYGYYVGGYSTQLSQNIQRLNLITEILETLSTSVVTCISLNSASLNFNNVKGFISGGKLSVDNVSTNTVTNATYRLSFAVPEAIAAVSGANLSQARWGLAGVSYSTTSNC